jgi:ABC-type metal ion transport system substrate-binding protein
MENKIQKILKKKDFPRLNLVLENKDICVNLFFRKAFFNEKN